MLTEILAENPSDPFARYGLAMEYSKAGDIERALAAGVNPANATPVQREQAQTHFLKGKDRYDHNDMPGALEESRASLEIVASPTPTLYADLLGTVDGLTAFHCRRMGLRLVPAWPLDAGRSPTPLANVSSARASARVSVSIARDRPPGRSAAPTADSRWPACCKPISGIRTTDLTSKSRSSTCTWAADRRTWTRST